MGALMIGDTVRVDGREYVVVFDGRQSLLPPRPSAGLPMTKDERRQAMLSYRRYRGVQPTRPKRRAQRGSDQLVVSGSSQGHGQRVIGSEKSTSPSPLRAEMTR